MPDTSTPSLAELTALAEDDLFHAIDVSASDPKDRKITLSNARRAFLAGVVDVASYATGGTGTSGSPWTGWESVINTAQTTYYFRQGQFNTAGLTITVQGVHLIGEASTIIKHTGTGVAITIGPTAANVWHFGTRVENIVLIGNANTTDGWALYGLRKAYFNHVEAHNLTADAFHLYACVDVTLINPFVYGLSSYQGISYSPDAVPAWGMVLDSRASDGSQTTQVNVFNGIFEHLVTGGIWCRDTFFNCFYGGTSEANTGKGVVVQGAPQFAKYNSFINFDCEQNGGKDWDINGASTLMLNCIGGSNNTDSTYINETGTTIIGGTFAAARFDAPFDGRVENVIFTGLQTVRSGSGGRFVNAYDTASSQYIIGTSFPAVPESNTKNASFTPATNSIGRYLVNVLDDTLISNPSFTPTEGQTIEFDFNIQVTGKTVTWGDKFVGYSSASITAVRSADSGNDYKAFRWSALFTKWHQIGGL